MLTEQPSYDVKKATLEGEETDWTYICRSPDVTTARWTTDDWIRYIGDRWHRKGTSQATSEERL